MRSREGFVPPPGGVPGGGVQVKRRPQNVTAGATAETGRWLAWLPATAAAAAVAAYVGVALLRLSYPFELEWMEGAMVEHVRRVLDGEPLYVEPSLEFVPFIYPPLYYYVSAAAAAVAGIGFAPLRAVSFVASLGCFALIAWIVYRETTDRYTALLAAGLFAAAYGAGGAWYDTGRVDTLFLMLILGFAASVREPQPTLRMVGAGLLFAAAYLTKQSALVLGAPLMVYALLRNWRAGVVLVAVAIVATGAAVLAIEQASGGWFLFYTWTIPRQHALLPGMLTGFWMEDILRPMPVAFFAALATLAWLLRTRITSALYLGALATGCVAAAWLSRLHSGGWVNVVIPAYAAGAVMFGVALHHALRLAAGAPAVGRRRVLIAGTYAAAVLQFALLWWNPLAQVPGAADAEAGRRMVERIAQLPGSVFVTGHGYLAVAAGKPSYAHVMALNDIFRVADNPAKARLAEEFGSALRERRFDALVMDSDFSPECGRRNEARITDVNWFCADVRDNYYEAATLVEGDAFWPVTGTPRRPLRLYLPAPAESAAPP